MSAGAADAYEELFTYACPKFVSAVGPEFTSPTLNTNMEAFKEQLR